MFPAAYVGSTTLTGDTISPPGIPTVLIKGKPASALGDPVAGAACTGAVTMGSPTVLFMMRPATRVTSQVTGANPATGVPVTTAVGVGEPTVLIA
jgi:uncharacterized Zn-binding protein involved in type VI secretion